MYLLGAVWGGGGGGGRPAFWQDNKYISCVVFLKMSVFFCGEGVEPKAKGISKTHEYAFLSYCFPHNTVCCFLARSRA